MAKPKCIVIPFQEKNPTGIGLALHFLLGNVIAVHGGFAECWFGWRAGKIFTSSDTLLAYIQMQGASMDPTTLSRQQKVRCWIYGKMENEGVNLSLFDSDKTAQASPEYYGFTVRDHLIGFREQCIDWLGRCGHTMDNHRRPAALWPERTSVQGVQLFGKALTQFYVYSAYGGRGRIDISPFEAAVSAAHDSFMANNLLGWAHFRNQDTASAKSCFDRALSLNPNSPGVMSGLMWCAINEKHVDDAVYWAVKKAIQMQEDAAAAAMSARSRCDHFNVSALSSQASVQSRQHH